MDGLENILNRVWRYWRYAEASGEVSRCNLNCVDAYELRMCPSCGAIIFGSEGTWRELPKEERQDATIYSNKHDRILRKAKEQTGKIMAKVLLKPRFH